MLLGVNVDHVATLREARKGEYPDPVIAANHAIKGGADGITVHLREDRRHIQDRDLKILVNSINVELNLEMAATDEMIGIAVRLRPDMVTLVPEKRQELTTEGGLDLVKGKKKIQKAIDTIQAAGIPVSLFINPSETDVAASESMGAAMVEIHTGRYADAKGRQRTLELKRVKDAVKKGLELGLFVNAGHGLNSGNVKSIAAIKGIRALYIGHGIISDSVFVGLEKAVRDMKKLIKESCKAACS